MFESLMVNAAVVASSTPTPPHKTDFSTWSRKTLEEFARTAADENAVLKEDLKAALAAWREAVKDSDA